MSLANGPVIAAQKRGHTAETSMQYSYRKILDFAIDEQGPLRCLWKSATGTARMLWQNVASGEACRNGESAIAVEPLVNPSGLIRERRFRRGSQFRQELAQPERVGGFKNRWMGACRWRERDGWHVWADRTEEMEGLGPKGIRERAVEKNATGFGLA